jgi:purine-binding chemotaxis protein CheW
VSLAERTFGIDVRRVGSIVERPPVTPVPNTPSFVLGVCSIHGAIHSVVDIFQLLSFGPRFDEGDLVPVVTVVTGPEFSCGVAVESVGELLHIPSAAITDSNETVPYVTGVYHRDGDSVLVLDVPALFQCPEMTQFR